MQKGLRSSDFENFCELIQLTDVAEHWIPEDFIFILNLSVEQQVEHDYLSRRLLARIILCTIGNKINLIDDYLFMLRPKITVL